MFPDSYYYYTKPYFNHGLNGIERMQDIWDDIMWDQEVEKAVADYRAYCETDQYWKDYMINWLTHFQWDPETYGMGEVA
jgi:hypothetical protein